MTAYSAPRDLGDGLVLRLALREDIERVATLTSHVFRERPDEPPSENSIIWMRDLGSGRHPFTDVDRCLLVEDTRTGKVVSSMWLIPTTWRYGSIPFGVGRPEEVATDPEYRRRGLIRAMFERFHARSTAEGDLAQAVTGIPYFYRQFGYEYAIDLAGGRVVSLSDIPAPKPGTMETFRLRPATEDDLPFVIELYEQERRRSLVSADIPIDYWRWLLQGINPRSPEGWATLIILDPDNRPCGYALPRSARWGPRLGVRSVALVAGVSYQAVVPSLLRALQAFAAAAPSSRPDQPLTGLAFTMGTEHPLYQVLGESLAPRRLAPYAWYVRVPDLPGFVRHIAPVLEERLAASPAVDRSGQLLLDFYRGGLRLVFKDGRLAVAENWQRPLWVDQPGAGFPPLVFLQLLFGRRDLDELRYAYPDVWASDQAELLLRALFPRAPSYLMELN